MPAGAAVLTAEFKVKLLAPGAGESVVVATHNEPRSSTARPRGVLRSSATPGWPGHLDHRPASRASHRRAPDLARASGLTAGPRPSPGAPEPSQERLERVGHRPRMAQVHSNEWDHDHPHRAVARIEPIPLLASKCLRGRPLGPSLWVLACAVPTASGAPSRRGGAGGTWPRPGGRRGAPSGGGAPGCCSTAEPARTGARQLAPSSGCGARRRAPVTRDRAPRERRHAPRRCGKIAAGPRRRRRRRSQAAARAGEERGQP